MKEDFLHYIWQFRKYDIAGLKTFQGEEVNVVSPGQYLRQAGPDFFNASLIIGSQKWAGNVEIHVKSSDWYHHNHEKDPAYDNIVLHVVWEHDTEVFRKDNTEIPVLELKHYVSTDILKSYNELATVKSWIFCEKELGSLNSFVMENWKERLFFERLERKANPVMGMANENANDWEAILFCFLAKNFGLNTNGDEFFKAVRAIPFSVIRKESFEVENLEALFFGMTGLLEGEKEDMYFKDLRSRFEYLCHKHQLTPGFVTLQFFKLRPDNFPTIRLSQLANLYNKHQNLFSKIVDCTSIQEIYNVFDVKVSHYWETHYQFDKVSPKKRKNLSASFIDLLVINTLIPFRFAYNKSVGKETEEELIDILRSIKPEKNAVTDKFRQFKAVVESAYDTQSLLQLKNEYCNNKKCLQCGIGLELLKS